MLPSFEFNLLHFIKYKHIGRIQIWYNYCIQVKFVCESSIHHALWYFIKFKYKSRQTWSSTLHFCRQKAVNILQSSGAKSNLKESPIHFVNCKKQPVAVKEAAGKTKPYKSLIQTSSVCGKVIFANGVTEKKMGKKIIYKHRFVIK